MATRWIYLAALSAAFSACESAADTQDSAAPASADASVAPTDASITPATDSSSPIVISTASPIGSTLPDMMVPPMGIECGAATPLAAATTLPGETTPIDGTPSHVCRASDAPQHFYSFVLPAHARAEIIVTPRGPYRLVARALASCDARECLTDDESLTAGASVKLTIDSPGDEPLTKIIAVSRIALNPSDEPGGSALYAIDLRLTSTTPPACDVRPDPAAGYDIVEVAPIAEDETESRALAVNDRGDVTGWGATPTATHSFLFRDGVTTVLGDVDATGTFATSINNDDRIVGYTNGGSTWRWDPNHFSLLFGPNGNTALPEHINNAGEIVGGFNAAVGVSHPVRWIGGIPADLGAIGPTGSAYATTNNERGQIAGNEVLADGSARGFFWDAGAVSEITDRVVNSVVVAEMNNQGVVVGQLYDPTGGHAFTWANGVLTRLPREAGHNSSASGINDHGQIVGTDVDEGASPSGFLYDGMRFWRLADVIPADSGWAPIYPYAISNCGHIVGLGVNARGFRGFVMTPRRR